jgi:hypothetical protein
VFEEQKFLARHEPARLHLEHHKLTLGNYLYHQENLKFADFVYAHFPDGRVEISLVSQ